MRAHPPATQPRSDAAWLPQGGALPVYIVARALGLHRSHIVSLIEEGELVAFDLRGAGSSRSTLRIPRQSLIQFLEARQSEATTDKPARRGDKYARKTTARG